MGVIKYKKTPNFIAPPIRVYPTDAGADVFSPIDVFIPIGDEVVVPLGFCLEVPRSFMAIVSTKTSTFKNGLIAHIPPVDCGYTGEVHALLQNISKKDIQINRGDKIAQLIILPIITPEFEETDEIQGGSRGDSGFGSTGYRLKREEY